jgi:hypothetical protein
MLNSFGQTSAHELTCSSAAVIVEKYAGLAQLVEQRFCKPKVTGSNPVSGSLNGVEDATTRDLQQLDLVF